MTMKDFLAHAGRGAEHGDSMMLRGWKSEGVCEVQIECDDAALIQPAAGGDLFIGGRAKVLLRNRTDVVPGSSEHVPAPQTELFIEL